MKTTIVLTAMLTLASAGTAHAVTLYTPMARAETGATHACRAVNVGKKPVPITVKRGDLSGTNDQTVCTSVEPGRACALLGAGPSLGYCQFDIDGSRKAVRAALTIEDASGTRLLEEAR